MRPAAWSGGAAAWGNRYDVKRGATFDAKPGSEIAPDDTDTSGKGQDGDGVEFWEKYEEEKILEMVKRDRSHPSLIMYSKPLCTSRSSGGSKLSHRKHASPLVTMPARG